MIIIVINEVSFSKKKKSKNKLVHGNGKKPLTDRVHENTNKFIDRT